MVRMVVMVLAMPGVAAVRVVVMVLGRRLSAVRVVVRTAGHSHDLHRALATSATTNASLFIQLVNEHLRSGCAPHRQRCRDQNPRRQGNDRLPTSD